MFRGVSALHVAGAGAAVYSRSDASPERMRRGRGESSVGKRWNCCTSIEDRVARLIDWVVCVMCRLHRLIEHAVEGSIDWNGGLVKGKSKPAPCVLHTRARSRRRAMVGVELLLGLQRAAILHPSAHRGQQRHTSKQRPDKAKKASQLDPIRLLFVYLLSCIS